MRISPFGLVPATVTALVASGWCFAADAPVRALKDIYEIRSAGQSSLVANSGFQKVYATQVQVQPGDVLRVRSQAEVTNDYRDPVAAHIRLVVDDRSIGSGSVQNVIRNKSHHMPLWADAVYHATVHGVVKVEVQLAAGRIDFNPAILVENEYGHLMIEHYREFPSHAAAVGAQARFLLSPIDSFHDQVSRIHNFGVGVPYEKVTAYQIGLPTQAGDFVRLFGQGTSQWLGPVLDMHGQSILSGTVQNGAVISPYSTENTPEDIGSVPLWTDAVHRVSDHNGFSGSDRIYTLAIHGVNGYGSHFAEHGGYLVGMIFRLASAVDAGQALQHLRSLSSSAEDKELLRFEANAGDWIRATGYLQFSYPNHAASTFVCSAWAELKKDGKTTGKSSMTSKAITPNLERLPLRVELFKGIEVDGEYEVQVVGDCAADRSQGNHLVLDQFRPLRR